MLGSHWCAHGCISSLYCHVTSLYCGGSKRMTNVKNDQHICSGEQPTYWLIPMQFIWKHLWSTTPLQSLRPFMHATYSKQYCLPVLPQIQSCPDVPLSCGKTTARLEAFPRKSIAQLTLHMGVSLLSPQKTTKLLHLNPRKISEDHTLYHSVEM